MYRGRTTLLDAGSSGLARYNSSDSCEVPAQPCYDAPTLDKVARIDLGAPPSVPGKDTTFVTGHSNRYHPDDPGRGVFSRLQIVLTGDTVVLTTRKGTFVYAVTTVLTVSFDRLTSTDEVVRVRADTVVAISCVVAADRQSYSATTSSETYAGPPRTDAQPRAHSAAPNQVGWFRVIPVRAKNSTISRLVMLSRPWSCRTHLW